MRALRHGQQPKLFDLPAQAGTPHLPRGLLYRPDFLTADEEAVLLVYIQNARMPLLQFGEHESKRRGMSWEYELPTFLLPLQQKVAKWLGVSRREINEAFVQEYPPGYGIGWHRDRETPRVIGISLAGWARMRFRPVDKTRLDSASSMRRVGDAQAVASVEVEPRSAYVMQGQAATRWQHSIAPVEALRYSITFRTIVE